MMMMTRPIRTAQAFARRRQMEKPSIASPLAGSTMLDGSGTDVSMRSQADVWRINSARRLHHLKAVSVINPVMLEPVVQFTLYLKVKYEVQQIKAT
jgi:hypothetical protein